MTRTARTARTARPARVLTLLVAAGLSLGLAGPAHAQGPEPVAGLPTDVWAEVFSQLPVTDWPALCQTHSQLAHWCADPNHWKPVLAQVPAAGLEHLAQQFAQHAAAKPLLEKIATEKRGRTRTLAGGTGGFADGLGTAARLRHPSGVAVGPDGTIYVADQDNHRIRKITPEGQVSTLAGDGTGGFAEGLGTAARLNVPTGVAVGPDGTVYVADQGNHRIRKITPEGQVSTLAGDGTGGFAEGLGTAARLRSPRGVAVDPVTGNIIVADTRNDRIRAITPQGQVTTLAGSTRGFADGLGTAARLDYPFGVAVGPDGTVYVADTGNHAIRRITPGGQVSTLAGNGTSGFADGLGTAARLAYPAGVAVGPDGTIYVADNNNHRIRRITPQGQVSTLAGNGTAGFAEGLGTAARLAYPAGVAVDSLGNILVADTDNHRVRQFYPYP